MPLTIPSLFLFRAKKLLAFSDAKTIQTWSDLSLLGIIFKYHDTNDVDHIRNNLCAKHQRKRGLLFNRRRRSNSQPYKILSRGIYTDVYQSAQSPDLVVKELTLTSTMYLRAFMEIIHQDLVYKKLQLSPRIVSVDLHKDLCFITMEKVHGTRLDHLMESNLWLQMSFKEKVSLLLEIARALQSIHHLGVGHGDFGASNIFIQNDNSLKIIDFGLSGTCLSDRLALDKLGDVIRRSFVDLVKFHKQHPALSLSVSDPKFSNAFHTHLTTRTHPQEKPTRAQSDGIIDVLKYLHPNCTDMHDVEVNADEVVKKLEAVLNA